MKIKIAVEVDTQAEALEIVNKLYGTRASIELPYTSNTELAQKHAKDILVAGRHPQPPISNEHVVEGGEQFSNENVTGQVDSEGLPWDERIHSSNKKKKANGAWVARRNVPDTTYQAVVAELRGGAVQPVSQPYVQAQYQPAPVAQPYLPGPVIPTTIPQPQPQPYADIPPFMAAAPMPQPQPQYQPAPVAQPQPPVQAQGQANFLDLLNKVQNICAAEPTNALNYINSITQRLSTQFQVQVQSINDITGHPHMIAYAMQLIAADGK